MHSRIELVATQQLQMQVPDAKRVQVVTLGESISPITTETQLVSPSAQPNLQLKGAP